MQCVYFIFIKLNKDFQKIIGFFKNIYFILIVSINLIIKTIIIKCNER